jgi:sulfur-oxidizing protein SoxY
MKRTRRHFLKAAVGYSMTGIILLKAQPVLAEWPASKFAAGNFAQTLAQVTNGKPIVETDKITLNIPEIAENGALVPMTVTSTLEDIRTFSIVVEHNPVPLALQVILMPELETFVSARLKIAESAFVHAIAESEKTCYSVKKKVKVTIGGCGG